MKGEEAEFGFKTLSPMCSSARASSKFQSVVLFRLLRNIAGRSDVLLFYAALGHLLFVSCSSFSILIGRHVHSGITDCSTWRITRSFKVEEYVHREIRAFYLLYTNFLFDLFFYPEDVDDWFSKPSADVQRTTWPCTSGGRNLQNDCS